MIEISFERMIEYTRAYDEIFGSYPETPYEGESVGEWVLDCAEGDKLITRLEHYNYLLLLGSIVNY